MDEDIGGSNPPCKRLAIADGSIGGAIGICAGGEVSVEANVKHAPIGERDRLAAKPFADD